MVIEVVACVVRIRTQQSRQSKVSTKPELLLTFGGSGRE
jgi:hypothetical protein